MCVLLLVSTRVARRVNARRSSLLRLECIRMSLLIRRSLRLNLILLRNVLNGVNVVLS